MGPFLSRASQRKSWGNHPLKTVEGAFFSEDKF